MSCGHGSYFGTKCERPECVIASLQEQLEMVKAERDAANRFACVQREGMIAAAVGTNKSANPYLMSPFSEAWLKSWSTVRIAMMQRELFS